jgi:hypothetical protein
VHRPAAPEGEARSAEPESVIRLAEEDLRDDDGDVWVVPCRSNERSEAGSRMVSLFTTNAKRGFMRRAISRPALFPPV